MMRAGSGVSGIQLVGYVSGGGGTVSINALTGGIGTEPATDDVVVVTCAVGHTSDLNIVISDPAVTPYTEVADLYVSDNYDANMAVAWKVMGATPDTSFQTNVPDASYSVETMTFVWRGVNTTTPMDVTATTVTSANSRRPNPPSITPTTSGAVIMAMGCAAHVSGETGTNCVMSSSELSNFQTAFDDQATASMTIGVGTYNWTSGAFDPAAWSTPTDDATNSWAAVTLALRPA